MTKYRAKSVKTEDGEFFASKAEHARWRELRLLELAGSIKHLRRQPKFKIAVNGFHICDYIADFDYLNERDKYVVEDVKGVLTPVYRLKKKLVAACHGIEITEVKAKRSVSVRARAAA